LLPSNVGFCIFISKGKTIFRPKSKDAGACPWAEWGSNRIEAATVCKGASHQSNGKSKTQI